MMRRRPVPSWRASWRKPARTFSVCANRLREALEQGNADTLAAVAHKMIPLFTLIGAGQTVTLLRRLEASKGQPLDEALKAVAQEALDGVEEVLEAAR